MEIFRDVSGQFEVDRIIGSGTYSVVSHAVDIHTRRDVAIKFIPNLEGDVELMRCTLREITLMYNLSHKNILPLCKLQRCNLNIFLVMPFYVRDLHKLIYKENCIGDCLSIFYQILSAVSFIHSVGVIHRDIKPGNILLDENFQVKLCDFGFARVIDRFDEYGMIHQKSGDLTEYMVTRYYRAPEVMVTPGRYGKAQDIWSVACTMAEFIRQYPLFPGSTTVNQLKLIVDVMGAPTSSDLNFLMSDYARRYLMSLASTGLGLPYELGNASDVHDDLYDLLREMLQFNPRNRITSDLALQLPIFSNCRRKFGPPEIAPPLSRRYRNLCSAPIPEDDVDMVSDFLGIIGDITEELNAQYDQTSTSLPVPHEDSFTILKSKTDPLDRFVLDPLLLPNHEDAPPSMWEDSPLENTTTNIHGQSSFLSMAWGRLKSIMYSTPPTKTSTTVVHVRSRPQNASLRSTVQSLFTSASHSHTHTHNHNKVLASPAESLVLEGDMSLRGDLKTERAEKTIACEDRYQKSFTSRLHPIVDRSSSNDVTQNVTMMHHHSSKQLSANCVTFSVDASSLPLPIRGSNVKMDNPYRGRLQADQLLL